MEYVGTWGWEGLHLSLSMKGIQWGNEGGWIKQIHNFIWKYNCISISIEPSIHQPIIFYQDHSCSFVENGLYVGLWWKLSYYTGGWGNNPGYGGLIKGIRRSSSNKWADFAFCWIYFEVDQKGLWINISYEKSKRQWMNFFYMRKTKCDKLFICFVGRESLREINSFGNRRKVT